MDRRQSLQLMSAAALGVSLGGCRYSPVPADMESAPGMPAPRFIETNGISMAVYEAGSGLPVVFCHGFPELAFSWRHQFHALADAGFHPIAPDLRGYGLTDRPPAIEDYTAGTVCDDLAGMLDVMNLERAVFCGHDWGAYIADTMGVLFPERCLGIISIGAANNQRPPGIPYTGRRGVVELVDKPAFNRFLQQPDVPEELLEANVEEFFRLLHSKDLLTADRLAGLPEDAPERSLDLSALLAREWPGSELFMPREAHGYYVRVFRATGFTGALNWYRAMDATIRELGQRQPSYEVEVPYLYVWPEQDPINRLGLDNGMEDYIADLEKRELTGSGHFAMEETPEALNSIILNWIKRKFPQQA